MVKISPSNVKLSLSLNSNGQKISFMVPNNDQLTLELYKCDKSMYDEWVSTDKDDQNHLCPC